MSAPPPHPPPAGAASRPRPRPRPSCTLDAHLPRSPTVATCTRARREPPGAAQPGRPPASRPPPPPQARYEGHFLDHIATKIAQATGTEHVPLEKCDAAASWWMRMRDDKLVRPPTVANCAARGAALELLNRQAALLIAENGLKVRRPATDVTTVTNVTASQGAALRPRRSRAELGGGKRHPSPFPRSLLALPTLLTLLTLRSHPSPVTRLRSSLVLRPLRRPCRPPIACPALAPIACPALAPHCLPSPSPSPLAPRPSPLAPRPSPLAPLGTHVRDLIAAANQHHGALIQREAGRRPFLVEQEDCGHGASGTKVSSKVSVLWSSLSSGAAVGMSRSRSGYGSGWRRVRGRKGW